MTLALLDVKTVRSTASPVPLRNIYCIIATSHHELSQQLIHLQNLLSIRPILFKKLKTYLTLVCLLGLGVATPQQQLDPSIDDSIINNLSWNLEKNVKETLAELEQQNKISAGSIQDIAGQFGWQVAGSLDGNILKLGKVTINAGQAATVTGAIVNAETIKDWATSFGTTAMAFLPKVSVMGNLPGFLNILMTIAVTLEKHHFAEVHALRQQADYCFTKEGRTYSDLCNNCKPHLAVSLLGKLNGCSADEVVDRDAPLDYSRALGFCSTVLCNGYSGGGTLSIISQAHRFDPLRAFWCKTKQEQIGLLMNNRIGEAIGSSLDVIDYDEFRKRLEEPCKKLVGDDAKNFCPTKAEIQKANDEFPPISYCQAGKQPSKEKIGGKTEQDPEDSNLFVVTETGMQYRKEGPDDAVWTGKCGTYIDSSDGKLNHGCCGPFSFDGASMPVKPEDGAPWCRGAENGKKVPEDLFKIKLSSVS